MSRRIRVGAALALAAAALAGCGGGGDASAELPPAGPPAAPVAGAAPEQSAVQALAALGAPAAVDPSESEGTLTGLDRFGLPHDLFDALIERAEAPAPAGGLAGGVAAPSAPTVPVPMPYVPAATLPAVPTTPTTPVAGGGTTTTAAASEPAGTAAAGLTKEDAEPLVASLSISGEALVARAGDAVPPDSQELVVVAVGGDRVVLRLVRGLLPDGSDRVTLAVGESVTLRDALLGRTYSVKLLEVLVPA